MTNETDPILNQDEVHAQEQSTDNTHEQNPEINNAESNTDSDVNAKLAELQDKYIRLYSDFENFRKRTQKEKSDLLLSAGSDVIKTVLPTLDDFERAIKANETIEDIASIKEGFNLIFNKLKNALVSKGLEPMQSVGLPFDSDIHEAITNIPAPTEDLKGKIIDEVDKGYYLYGKVIRFAKVIVGN